MFTPVRSQIVLNGQTNPSNKANLESLQQAHYLYDQQPRHIARPAIQGHLALQPTMDHIKRCSVCKTAKSVTVSNGPPICSSCRKFIQKIVSRSSSIPTECITRQNNCFLTEDSRNNCRYCRFSRYIECTSQPLLVSSRDFTKKMTKTKPAPSLANNIIGTTGAKCVICGNHLRVQNRLNVTCCQACYKFAHDIGDGKSKCPTECISGRNNCIIDPKSRGQCRFCRLQRCLMSGMNIYLPEEILSSPSRMRQNSPPTTSTAMPAKKSNCCPVCNSEHNMTIYNYNSACNNCKKFINKIKLGRSSVPIKCISGSRNCIIDEKLKSYCRFCRLQKCLRLGMSIQLPARRDAVQRIPKPKPLINGKICVVCDCLQGVENCYTIPCCQACTKFVSKIKRDKRSTPTKCSTGCNNCIINESTRTKCRYCRLQKFLNVFFKANPTRANPLGNLITQ